MGIDTFGSVFKKYHETGIFDKTKSIHIQLKVGEDIIPENVDFKVIDHFESKIKMQLYTRKLLEKKGFLLVTCGAAIAGLIQLKVILKKTKL